MSALGCVLALLSFASGGCRDEMPTGGALPSDHPVFQSILSSDSVCARLTFTITSSTAVTTTFPSRTTCISGLVVIKGPNATWAQNPNRRLQLFVRVLNKGTEAIQLPVRLYLPSTGTTVTAPSGTPSSKVVAVTPDSSEAGGGRIWFIGGSGVLAVNDSTRLDTLAFNVQSPATAATFQFLASAATFSGAPGGWPKVRDSFPTLDTSRTIVMTGDTARYYRTEALVRFANGTNDAAKQAILTGVGATVIAATPAGGIFIRFPDPGNSLTAYRAFLDGLASKSGVTAVSPILRSGARPMSFARFPSDGSGQTRSDWVGASTSTWALRAIRAPLAWGCENGLYSTAVVRTGILEYKHEPTHPEFQASSPVLWQPNDVALQHASVLPSSTFQSDTNVTHATATTGLLAAAGDNGSGIAGLIWRTNLRQYALKSSGNRLLDLTSGMYILAGALLTDSLNVLSLSTDEGFRPGPTQAERVRMIEDVASELRNLLSQSPKLLIVVATGNEKFNGTATAYTAVDTAGVVRSALLKLRGEPAYQNRIVVVAGSKQNNQYWNQWPPNTSQGSNYFTNLTDLVAPAQDIPVLVRWTGGAVPITTSAGTSLSAPMVAGVAAMLYQMDPTLTPEQVKDYLVRGAKEKRPDPTTGVLTSPTAVSGAPGTVYQLDAYGSLALLSKERPSTPICGEDVAFEYSPDFLSGRVIVRRAIAETIPVVSTPARSPISVAPGGRLFAVGYWNVDLQTNQTTEYQLQSTGWTQGQTLSPMFARLYLEKDTLDWPSQLGSATLRGSQWGPGGTSVDFPALVSKPLVDWWVQVSPDAKYAIYRSSGNPPPGCGGNELQVWLVALPAGPAQSLEGPSCAGSSGLDRDAAWDPTGKHFVTAQSEATAIYRSWTIGASGVTADGALVPITGRELSTPFVQHFTDPTGVTAAWVEVDAAGTCYLATRRAGAAFASASQAANPMCSLPVRTLRSGDEYPLAGSADTATKGRLLRSRGLIGVGQ